MMYRIKKYRTTCDLEGCHHGMTIEAKSKREAEERMLKESWWCFMHGDWMVWYCHEHADEARSKDMIWHVKNKVAAEKKR